MPPRPPLAKTARIELNWQTSDMGNQAHNIMYVLSAGSTDEISVSDLTDIANAVYGTSAPTGAQRFLPNMYSGWQLISVTASDNGGSDNTASAVATTAGATTGTPLPPQCAVCVSWTISARYRGGHPRTYFPGLLSSDLVAADFSELKATTATNWEEAGLNFLDDVNGTMVSGVDLVLGTVSYFTGNAPRTTPLFRIYTGAHVHRRLDSQRRRSGKESTFPVI